MAMFKFEQLENNIFYFTDTIPETKKLVNFINETDNDDSIKPEAITKWRTWYASNDKSTIYGQQKMLDVGYIKRTENISPRILFIINSYNSDYLNYQFLFPKYPQIFLLYKLILFYFSYHFLFHLL